MCVYVPCVRVCVYHMYVCMNVSVIQIYTAQIFQTSKIKKLECHKH